MFVLQTKMEKKKPSLKLLYPISFLMLGIFILFYPGDSVYVRMFFSHRDIFATHKSSINIPKSAVAYVKNPSIQPTVTAQGIYVIDLQSSTPVLSQKEHEAFLPASTVKVITALTAYDVFDLDSVLEVKRIIKEGQTVDFVLGERLTFENLLYAILVHSGNDAAYVIADNYPGGEKAFVTAMNKKAQDLGMKNTIIKNPAGLDSFGQHTSPFDLTLAGRALLLNKRLANIVSVKNITITDVDFNHFHHLSNVNELLGSLPGVGGLKTGYTIDAGENLITLYKSNGHEFLIVIMKSSDRFEDTRNIISWLSTNIDFIDPEVGLK